MNKIISSVIASAAKQSLFLSLRAHVVSRLPGVSSIRRSSCRVAISILSFLSSAIANSLGRMKQSLFLSFQNIILSFRRKPESRIFLSLRGHIVTAAISFFFTLPSSAFAEDKIPVFPTTPVEVYTVYGSLALFWIAIIFLIIVIKMKLNEIERIKKLGIDEEDENAPILD